MTVSKNPMSRSMRFWATVCKTFWEAAWRDSQMTVQFYKTDYLCPQHMVIQRDCGGTELIAGFIKGWYGFAESRRRCSPIACECFTHHRYRRPRCGGSLIISTFCNPCTFFVQDIFTLYFWSPSLLAAQLRRLPSPQFWYSLEAQRLHRDSTWC